MRFTEIKGLGLCGLRVREYGWALGILRIRFDGGDLEGWRIINSWPS